MYAAQAQNGIVRAKTDIAVLTPITADMVEIVRISPADAPANAARSLDAIVGRYAAVAILAGQDVDLRIPRRGRLVRYAEGVIPDLLRGVEGEGPACRRPEAPVTPGLGTGHSSSICP